MTAFNYISYLRDNCIPAEECAQEFCGCPSICAIMPDLEGRVARVTMDGFAEDSLERGGFQCEAPDGCAGLNTEYLPTFLTPLISGGGCDIESQDDSAVWHCVGSITGTLYVDVYLSCRQGRPQLDVRYHGAPIIGFSSDAFVACRWITFAEINAFLSGQLMQCTSTAFAACSPGSAGQPLAVLNITLQLLPAGGEGASLAATHDIELDAQGIGPASCPVGCNELNNAFLQSVALNPNVSQSFATGAVQQCDTNRYFSWHYTIRPFGQPNPGVLIELREIQLDEFGEFEYTIAHWEYVGDPSILYNGGSLVAPLKIPLPPNPNVSCGFLDSSVTIRSFPIE